VGMNRTDGQIASCHNMTAAIISLLSQISLPENLPNESGPNAVSRNHIRKLLRSTSSPQLSRPVLPVHVRNVLAAHLLPPLISRTSETPSLCCRAGRLGGP
jgi:hypothetical protein